MIPHQILKENSNNKHLTQ